MTRGTGSRAAAFSELLAPPRIVVLSTDVQWPPIRVREHGMGAWPDRAIFDAGNNPDTIHGGGKSCSCLVCSC